jgi:hypothetical protein
MSNDHRKTDFAIYKAALNQIVMHEFAHHFLDHLARIKGGKLARIDAEFEADLFAILNGVQAGEPASAMFYFFDAMAEIEQRTQILKTNDYESGSCRSSNVDNITEFFGITPILVLDGAFGGGAYASRTSPQMFFSLGKEQFAHTPTLKSGYCGRIASVALPAAFEELRHLYLRVGEDVKFLYSDQQNPDSDRANRLLRDLAEMSTTFHYMDGIAMKCMALMLQKWGLKGHRLTPLLGQVDKLVNTPELAGKFQSEDLGRLFLAEGIAVFQEQKQLPRQARLDRSYSLLQRAVLYNPDLAEAWQNLGFIAFMRANCRSASNFGDRSIATMSAEQDSKTLEGVRFFAQYMKLLSSDQNRCAAEGSKFEPY